MLDQNFYSSILETVHDGLWVTDASDQIFFVNRSMERIAGASAEQITGLNVTTDFPPETTGQFLPHYLKAKTTLQAVHYEVEVVTPGGRPTVQAGSLTPLVKDGVFNGIICTIQDITEIRRAEQDYHRLFNEMGEGFGLNEIICDDEGKPIDFRILDVNPAFERLMEMSREEAIGQTAMKLLPLTEKYWLDRFGEVALKGTRMEFEEYSTDLDKFFHIHAFQPKPGQFACIFSDITPRKKSEEERNRLEQELIQAQKMESIGRLAGGVAHDFNNMLAVILGNAENALEEVSPESPLNHELKEIRKAAERSADLTRQLLAFARRQTVQPRVLSLNETIEGMVNMLRRLIGKDIQLNWEPCNNCWAAFLDPGQFGQLLTNLCLNARDAMDSGGIITILLQNETLNEDYCRKYAALSPGEYLKLSIEDNGRGMDAETLEHIFEPFYTTKDLNERTGLGLATVYGIVKQNKGAILVESSPDQGTSFHIYFPRHRDSTPSSAPPQAETKGGKETILFVEDEPAILNIGQRQLQSFGYKTLGAETPNQALEMVEGKEDSIQILITDVVMPEMNGRALHEKLQVLIPELKCLYISGYTSDILARHGILEEEIHFLQKPFTKEELGAKVREILGEI